MLAHLPSETDVLGRLLAWAQPEPAVRAVLMTSSRARPAGPVDVLSDYDLILVVTDAERFRQEEAWQQAYGQPLARWGDQSTEAGLPTSFCGVVYTDYVKIDYTVWPLALMDRFTQTGVLPAELDAGYRVLLDKDARATGWPAPTLRAYVPARPTAADYQALVEEFGWAATYLAKSLWRDELVFAHWCLDNELRAGVLRRLLEWRLELDHAWSLRPGVQGRRLKQQLPPDLWADLQATFPGPALEDHWAALSATTTLFRRVASEVGAALGYTYSAEIDARMTAFLAAVRTLPR